MVMFDCHHNVKSQRSCTDTLTKRSPYMTLNALKALVLGLNFQKTTELILN